MKKASLTTVLAFVLAAALGWFLAPSGEASTALVQARRDAWVLPALPRKPDMVGEGLTVVTSPIFGAEPQAAAAAAPVEDPRWRLAGIFRSGKQPTALISFAAPGKEALRLRVGESLPSGHKIIKIDDSEVCVQIGKKVFRLGVEYRGE